jgi:AraC-like DNA-binding protein
MSDGLLSSCEKESSFFKAHTRPTPLPPSGVDLGVLEVCHVRCPPREIIPAAESYFCSFVWGVSGQFTFCVNDLKYSVEEGEFLFLEPGGIFRAEANDKDNRAYYLLMDGAQAWALAQECEMWSGIFPYTRSPAAWLERIAGGMEDVSMQENLASIGHSLLLSAFQDAVRTAPDRMVWDACCFLQKNWSQPGMNVESVLTHLGVSRSTLSPRFRRIMGKSILEYLMDIRYRNAVNMLHNDHESIITISKRCGFPSTSYFSTWFRKYSGVSPRTMKKKMAERL